MKHYRTLILDMDGTIMDSLETSERALSDTCKLWNIPMTDQLLTTILYSSTDALMTMLDLGERGGGFLRDLTASCRRHDHLMRAFPDVDLLVHLDVPKGIVTAETRIELMGNLDKLGFPRNRFGAFSCAGDTPYLKPHPRPLLHCLEQLKADPSTALYVGDGTHDLHCALTAGVDFGLAGWGARDRQAFGEANYMFDSPKDILPLY